jgi:hypothetical protein
MVNIALVGRKEGKKRKEATLFSTKEPFSHFALQRLAIYIPQTLDSIQVAY